jgi:D-cysteine desulfhydrase
MFNATPIRKIAYDEDGINLYIKRDDLIPLSFGGNKVRIAEEYYTDMDSQGKNCMIGYGNARSNLCRVLANINSKRGGCCYIVSPADDNSSRTETSNSRLVKACGAVIHTCQKSDIAQTVQSVIDDCNAHGLKPYYINGNKFGKGNEAVPVRAYAKAYKEILEQSKKIGIKFDYIFLATGTGMTQAGLLAGQSVYGGDEKIVGISVARDSAKETAVIDCFLSAYAVDSGTEKAHSSKICVCDDYLCGGYGKYDKRISETIINTYTENGIPLDPTYTGKAFFGMKEYLKNNGITNKNVLFIHTGGTPLFFDFLQGAICRPDIMKCTNKAKLASFLDKIDSQLPTSLSSRFDINEYACKVIDNGNVLSIENDGEIVSAILFYSNDMQSKKAYITLLGTVSGFENRKYAHYLMNAAEEVSRSAGIRTIHLDTEKQNTRAISFYSKQGYVIESVTPKIHMVKEL